LKSIQQATDRNACKENALRPVPNRRGKKHETSQADWIARRASERIARGDGATLAR
jgi:hypothetical protein